MDSQPGTQNSTMVCYNNIPVIAIIANILKANLLNFGYTFNLSQPIWLSYMYGGATNELHVTVIIV